MNRSLILLLAMILLGSGVYSQTIDHGATNTWFMTKHKFRLSDRWSGAVEVHERLAGFLDNQGFFIVRPSIGFALQKEVIASVGYSHINATPFDPYPLPVSRSENNMWEQLFFNFKTGKTKIQNRIRQEHRWIDHVAYEDTIPYLDGSSDFTNRFRFRIIAIRDLITFKNEDKLFVKVFDEIWLSQPKGILPKNLARNWFYAGFGYTFSPVVNLQMGVMHQWDKIGTDHFISSPIIQTSLVFNWDLTKKD